MNIVIVSHYYEKDGVMGSVRWTSLAHRLARENTVYVVTNNEDSGKFYVEKHHGIVVLKADDICSYVKRRQRKTKASPVRNSTVSPLSQTGRKSAKALAKDIIRNILYQESMRNIAKKNAAYVLNYFRENNIRIDCVISTSKPFVGCFIGYYLAKALSAKWILDQRDLPHSEAASEIEIRIYRYFFKKFDKCVSKYIFVSNGMCRSFQELYLAQASSLKKLCVLNNGYARENNCDAGREVSKPGKLVFGYVGDLYSGRRDTKILFDAIHYAETKYTDFSKDFIEIQYAGSSSSSLYEYASAHRYESIIVDNGYVPYKESIAIQNKADLLLLLTWNTQEDQGILPGKFYEYMLAYKPIVCITSGEVPDGEADQMMRSMNLGIAVDYIKYEENVQRLGDYIYTQWSRKNRGMGMLYNPELDKVVQYDYDYIYLRLMDIIEGIP